MSSEPSPTRSRRLAAVFGSFVFFWIAPGTVAGWIPWTISGWRMGPPLMSLDAGRWLGGALLAAGAIVVVECFARFALQGLGTFGPSYESYRAQVGRWWPRITPWQGPGPRRQP